MPRNPSESHAFSALSEWRHTCLFVGMAYAITDTCTKDNHCIEACPVNCIHPTPDEPNYAEVPHLYVHPDECIDCGACVPVCPTNSVFPVEEVPEDKQEFIAINANYYLN